VQYNLIAFCLQYTSAAFVDKLQISSLSCLVSFSVPRPNMDKYVFLKVLENQEQVMIDPEYVLTIFTACHMKTANQNTGEPLYT